MRPAQISGIAGALDRGSIYR